MRADNTPALAGPRRDPLVVLVSELVSNAVIHGRPDVMLHQAVAPDLVTRVDVVITIDVASPSAPCTWTPGG